jgi:hypothetical protein
MKSENNSAEQSARNHAKRFGAILCAVIAVLGIVIVTQALVTSRASLQPIPQLSEIARIEATAYDPQTDKDVTFEVPEAHWKAVLSALLPAQRDEHALKWVIHGDLRLKLKDGSSFAITVYTLSEDPGAFSAGPTREQRVYYRGGSSSAVVQTLTEARLASKKAEAK